MTIEYNATTHNCQLVNGFLYIETPLGLKLLGSIAHFINNPQYKLSGLDFEGFMLEYASRNYGPKTT